MQGFLPHTFVQSNRFLAESPLSGHSDYVLRKGELVRSYFAHFQN